MSNELFGEVVKTISLDFAQKTSPVTVFAKQGDNRTRIIHIQPLMNGVPMNIDTSFQYVAKFAAKKPDGHYVYNDSANINEDGTITVTLTDQTLAAHGNAICCVILETQSNDVLTSQNFTLIIEFSAGAYQSLASSDEIMGLDDKLAQVQELINKLGEEIQGIPPINPEDKDKVLTANEDGTASWKTPAGGNGGNANFLFANSKEELPDPSTVPENTIGLVPAEREGGGSSVQPDYNQNDSEQPDYIKNRPFYEETVTGEVVIEYDGDSTGKVVVSMGEEGQLVKVSDLTPEPSEIIGGTGIVNGESMTITEDMVMDGRTEGVPVVVVAEVMFVFYSPLAEMGVTETGIYFADMGVAATLKYTGTVTNIKKLDPKFLEFSKVSDTALVDETVTNDYTFTNYFAVVVGDTYLVEYDGTRYFCVAKTLTVGDVFVTYLGNADVVGLEDTGEPFIIYNTEEKWIFGTKSSTPDHSIKIYHVECAKIPKECLPDDIGSSGLPEVTAEDNGKFLQVVDGAYALVALTDVSVEGA